MIYQYVPILLRGDAVGNEVTAISDHLTNSGVENMIVTDQITKGKNNSITYEAFTKKATKKDVLFFHMASSCAVWKSLRDLPCKKIMIYHNITPAEFFLPYAKDAVKTSKQARAQLAEGASFFDAGWADSQYNADELTELGYKNVSVMPLLIAFEDYKKEPNQKIIDAMNDGFTNILFVGRMVPNKRFEDLVAVFAEYKKLNPESRLILVGSDYMKPYVNKLHNFAKDLMVKDVLFQSHAPFPDILAYYRSAHCFLCMSEHEGFCVPLLEAMTFRVPIVAYGRCAVPKTLGDGGVCVDDNDPAKVAAVMHAMLNDPELLAQMRENQAKHLENFNTDKILADFLDRMNTTLGQL